jgi:hypothetical protein
VAPAELRAAFAAEVLIVGVHRVVDEHVRLVHELDQLRVAVAVLGVRRIHDAAALVVDAVGEVAARVVRLDRAHHRFADTGAVARLERLVLHLRAEGVDGDG